LAIVLSFFDQRILIAPFRGIGARGKGGDANASYLEKWGGGYVFAPPTFLAKIIEKAVFGCKNEVEGEIVELSHTVVYLSINSTSKKMQLIT
jgi:hypothetical protein